MKFDLLCMRFPFSLLLTMALGFALPFPINAQGRRTPSGRPQYRREGSNNTPRSLLEEFERMSSEDRAKALAQLPAERRRRMEERLKRLRDLPADQRSSLMRQYGRFSELPAEHQDIVRNAWRRLSNQPPARKRALRDELRHLAAMPPADREARVNSPEFRAQYSSDEQHIIRDMSDVLPTR